jgi:hypothetical protein
MTAKTTKKANIKERNALFDMLSRQINRGQSVALYAGHRFERAAREFEAEGLVQISDTGPHPGEVLQITRNF